VVADSATILSRANQAIATLERYKTRLDEVSRQLSRAEIEDFVTLRDVMTVVQRLELVRRLGLEIDYDCVELGTDGRQLRLQLEELLGGNDIARELIVRDYHASPEPLTDAQLTGTLDELDALSDAELLDFTWLAKVFGYPTTAEAQDSALSPRGYRAMAEIPRLQFAHVDLLVRSFGTRLHWRDVGPPRAGMTVAAGGVDDHRLPGLSSLIRRETDREQPPAVPQAVAPSPAVPAPGQAAAVAGSG